MDGWSDCSTANVTALSGQLTTKVSKVQSGAVKLVLCGHWMH